MNSTIFTNISSSFPQSVTTRRELNIISPFLFHIKKNCKRNHFLFTSVFLSHWKFFISFRLKLPNGIVNLAQKNIKNQINRNPFIFIHSSNRSYKTSVLSKFNIVVEFRIEIKLHKNDPFSDFLSNIERKTSIGFAPHQQSSSHVLHME